MIPKKSTEDLININLQATWYLFTIQFFDQSLIVQPQMEIAGGLFSKQYSEHLFKFQEKHRIFSKLPGRAAFYRALSCYFQIRMADIVNPPAIVKTPRGMIMINAGCQFNNLEFHNIHPIENHTIHTLIANGELSPWFLTSQSRDTFDTCICRGLQLSTVNNKPDSHIL